MSSLGQGEVGVFLLSGKPSCSFDSDLPLGIYDIGMDSTYSIFETVIKRLSRLSELCFGEDSHRKIKVYVMASSENKKDIIGYFKRKDYMGYGDSNIFFFSQDVFPVINNHAKVLLREEGKVLMAPQGNGMLFLEIIRKNLVSHLEKNNIKYIYLAPINNILLKVADPTSLGFLISRNRDMVCNCVKNTGQYSKGFGCFGLSKNRTLKIFEEDHSSGSWVNTGSCYIKLESLKELFNNNSFTKCMYSELHTKRRERKCYDPKTKVLESTECIFFESYYHDIMEFMKDVGIVEVDPHQEFYPIKSFNQEFSIIGARKALWRLHQGWVEAAGFEIAGDGHIEFEPSLSYEGEDMNKILQSRGYLNKVDLPLYVN